MNIQGSIEGEILAAIVTVIGVGMIIGLHNLFTKHYGSELKSLSGGRYSFTWADKIDGKVMAPNKAGQACPQGPGRCSKFI